MRKKLEAHETLSVLFARDRVPHTLIMDGAKEQTMGQFRKKARQADCHIKETKPYSPWSNAAEGAIRELKKGVARNMLQTMAPKCLWDNCAKLEAIIRSHTSHNICKLDGQVPETLVTGSTANISEIAEFKWYQWVYFCDSTTVGFFPDDKEILGRYLGPSTDIGPSMLAKMLKGNGQTVVQTTFRPLTDHEELKEEMKQKKIRFDAEMSFHCFLGARLARRRSVALFSWGWVSYQSFAAMCVKRSFWRSDSFPKTDRSAWSFWRL
jgi:hypothetical protein